MFNKSNYENLIYLYKRPKRTVVTLWCKRFQKELITANFSLRRKENI